MNDTIDTLPQPGEYQQLFAIDEEVVVLHGRRRGEHGKVVAVTDLPNHVSFSVLLPDDAVLPYSIGDIIGKHYLEVVIPALEAEAREEAGS